MTDRPIIFSAQMVRALIDDRKTQTRRLYKPRPGYPRESGEITPTAHDRWTEFGPLPYAPGDRLWVREAFRGAQGYEGQPPALWGNKPVWFVADGAPPDARWSYLSDRSHPSIHMPRWASRLTLDVTDVRVQRLCDITEADAMAEGVSIPATPDGKVLAEIAPNSPMSYAEPRQTGETIDEFIARALTARTLFAALWEKLHGPNTWTANPWVVAVTFAVRHGNIDAKEAA